MKAPNCPFCKNNEKKEKLAMVKIKEEKEEITYECPKCFYVIKSKGRIKISK